VFFVFPPMERGSIDWRFDRSSGRKFKPFRLRKRGPTAMPKENDLEGAQDQGGKHGGQKGMPNPERRPPGGNDQGIVRDQRGQEQPRDKARAQQVSRQDRGGDPPGRKV
jgi:hypothetical protein